MWQWMDHIVQDASVYRRAGKQLDADQRKVSEADWQTRPLDKHLGVALQPCKIF